MQIVLAVCRSVPRPKGSELPLAMNCSRASCAGRAIGHIRGTAAATSTAHAARKATLMMRLLMMTLLAERDQRTTARCRNALGSTELMSTCRIVVTLWKAPTRSSNLNG